MRDPIRINEPVLDDEEIQAVEMVLRSGILTDKNGMGPRVLSFERKFSKMFETKYSIALSSGTAALHAALLAIGIKPEDEVILPSFTYVATAEVVVLTGAKPIFADINEETYNISIDSIENCLSRKTRAIIPVDLYGRPADLDPILEIAQKKDIPVIEDVAQALGAKYKDRVVGGIADVSCFSFYASKNITTGEGGLITTEDDDLADSLKAIRCHGEKKPYWVTHLGHNYRMSEIAAAIGNTQLEKLPRLLEAREKNANTLTAMLEPVERLQLPVKDEGFKNAWNLYTVRLKGANAGRRNKVVQKLRAKGIPATIYYETPVHLLPYYRDTFRYKRKMLPNTEKAARQVFSLPVHPKITDEDINYIVKNVKKILS